MSSLPSLSSRTSLHDVQTAYENSSYTPRVYALMPSKYRNNLLEDDVRIDAMINVLQSIIDGTEPNPKNKLSINYFKNHSKEAAAFVLNKIMEMDEDCYDCEDDFEDRAWNGRLPNLPPRVPLSPALQALIASSTITR
jgi:hypothetical protein